MDERSSKHQIEILKVLHDANQAMGSTRIVEALAAMGVNMNGRTVRFHLQRMDEEGLTDKISRRMGRIITDRGKRELESVEIVQRMRFVVSRIDSMCYDMSFDITKGSGSVVLNFSLVEAARINEALDEIEKAFTAGLGMGRLAMARGPGQAVGPERVPHDMIGIGTVCNVTMNGILLKMGIPVTSRYGCLLRMEGGDPLYFTQLVEYTGITVDPLDMFIKAGMTRVREVARGRSGAVGASFREIPANAGRSFESVYKRIERIGLAGVITTGKPNQPLFNVPVDEGTIGIAVVGGLNPVAAAHEAGCATTNTALHSLVDFSELHDFRELRSVVKQF
jgi:hypothetical protein